MRNLGKELGRHSLVGSHEAVKISYLARLLKLTLPAIMRNDSIYSKFT